VNTPKTTGIGKADSACSDRITTLHSALTDLRSKIGKSGQPQTERENLLEALDIPDALLEIDKANLEVVRALTAVVLALSSLIDSTNPPPKGFASILLENKKITSSIAAIICAIAYAVAKQLGVPI